MVAVPLHEVQQTLHRLVIVEALVAGAVILALLALGWFVIRVGLRPLERIGRVASEIAGGDLSRRVANADERTEVGRLGRSLNEMLTQIESAFAARQLSEAQLRRFLADASHELRTPLASIRGYAELFRMGAAEDPETLARAMSRIEGEATRMGVLVEDLLLLAQLDQAPEPRRVPVALGELIAHVAQDTQGDRARPRGARSTSSSTQACSAIPTSSRQLLANLTRNAVVHTPAGSPIDLSLGRRPGQRRAGGPRPRARACPRTATRPSSCSNASGAAKAAAAAGRAARAWGWRSCARSPMPTAVRSARPTLPGAAHGSRCELPLSEPGDLSGKSQPPHALGLLEPDLRQ